MDPKLRSIPFTIVDFLGTLVPGFVWLVLIVETFEVLGPGVGTQLPSPLTALRTVAGVGASPDGWVGTFVLVTASLSIGWPLRAFSMALAEVLARPLFWFDPENRPLATSSARFPFNAHLEPTAVFTEAQSLVREFLALDPRSLGGNHPFTAAKRILRLVAPALWEECERREAAARMTGTMFLAAIYAALLSAWILAANGLAGAPLDPRDAWRWLGFALVIALMLGLSFDRLRIAEVRSAYVNLIVAARYQQSGWRSAGGAEASSGGAGGD